MKNKYFFICILFGLIAIRVPALFFWNSYMTGHDAAIYMEKAINLAEGKGFTCSICRHITDIEELNDYIRKFGTQTQELKVAPLYIYLISVLYRLVGIENFMLAINLLNLFLFIITLLILYRYLLVKYPDSRLVQIGTVIIVGTNFMILELSYGAHMETFSLFLYVFAFIYHSWIVSKEKQHWLHVLLYSITLTLLFLSKYSVIPLVGAFIIHFMYLKKYRQFALISLVVLIGAGSWFILRDILMDGRVISNFGSFPFSTISKKIIAIPSFFTLIFKLSLIIQSLLSLLNGFYGLAFLFPFVIISILHFKYRVDIQINIFMIFITIALYFSLAIFKSKTYIDYRYFLPIVVFLIPVSLIEFERYFSGISRKIGRLILYILLLSIVFSQVIDTVKFTYDVKKKSLDRALIFKAADELIEKERLSDDKNILTNIIGYSVYASTGVVWAPGNLTSENKYNVIDTYEIDYILFCGEQKNYLSAWDQNVVPFDIFSDLQLVGTSTIDSRVKLYSTIRIN